MAKTQSRTPVNRPGDEAVQARTGKTWAEWFEAMDQAGAVEMSHKEIVGLLREFKVGPWWQQMVTVAYEQERGKRDPHQKPDGYEISRSRTIKAPLPAINEAWTDPSVRRRWLADPEVEIRKTNPGKTVRITWVDGLSHVTVYLYARGLDKNQVTVQHAKLKGPGEADAMKAYWEENLTRLKDLLES